jgi:hypothetical protein
MMTRINGDCMMVKVVTGVFLDFAELNLCVWIGGDQAPSDADWNASLKMLATRSKRAFEAGVPVRCLVFSDGGAPSASQRRGALRAIDEARVWGSVVTSSLLTHAAGTIFGWYYHSIMVFVPERIKAVLDFLEVPSDDSFWAELTLAAKQVDGGSRSFEKASITRKQ